MNPASFFTELKRRNVLRAGVLYIASVWALAQGIAQLGPSLDAPDWVTRWFLAAAAIGFPFWLAFAWFWEFTPQGLKRESEIDPADSMAHATGRKLNYGIFGVMAVVIVLLLTDRLVSHRESSAAASTVAASSNASTATALPHSIAVLAFDDLSPAHDQKNFSEGMAEEILNALTRVKALTVIGRSSSFQFQGKDLSPQQIGTRLGVAHVLEGSVRKQGEQLRITVALVQTSDGVQQWSNSYDGSLADVFKLQESCARDIAAQMKVVLGDHGRQQLVRRSSDNPDAYALFVEAQTLVNARVGDSLPRAIAKLEQATTLDPDFARAWSKLAVAYAVLPQYVSGDWKSSWEASDRAAKRALALDPDDAEAYAALSYNQFSQRHYNAMVEPMQRALTLNPGDSTVTYWAANELAAMGRTRDAETRIDAALTHDPANVPLLFYKSMLRWRSGDKAAALAFARRDGVAGSAFGAMMLSFYEAADGDMQAAARQFAKSESQMGSKIPPTALEVIFRGSYGDAAQHQAALNIVKVYIHDDWAPTMLLQIGESARSLDLYEYGGSGLSDAYLNWLWQPEAWSRKARQDPAFQGFAKRIGLLAYWKANQWPDLCQPAPERGPDAFTCR